MLAIISVSCALDEHCWGPTEPHAMRTCRRLSRASQLALLAACTSRPFICNSLRCRSLVASNVDGIICPIGRHEGLHRPMLDGVAVEKNTWREIYRRPQVGTTCQPHKGTRYRYPLSRPISPSRVSAPASLFCRKNSRATQGRYRGVLRKLALRCADHVHCNSPVIAWFFMPWERLLKYGIKR